MQGSLLSNVGDGTPTGKGKPTIATYNAMGYAAATFGNHEFDWGQVNLTNRTTEASLSLRDGQHRQERYRQLRHGRLDQARLRRRAVRRARPSATPPNTVKVAFIGVTTTETPIITVATATAGLCFKDPTESIVHYYDTMKADGADVIVVLSHLGYADGGYGYGIPVTGDQTLAANLIKAGKPVNLIIGGHSHTSVAAPGTVVTVSGYTGTTTVVQAAYNGRRVGQADITVGTDGSVTVGWKVYIWTDPDVARNHASSILETQRWRDHRRFYLCGRLKGSHHRCADHRLSRATRLTWPWSTRRSATPQSTCRASSGLTDNMMGTFVDDAIYNYLNTDAEPANDIDIFFNNAGGIRTDWCWSGTAWAAFRLRLAARTQRAC